MSAKRKANTELNHENWDKEDPIIEEEEEEEVGTFKTAPKEVMEKRVIRTAKRRTQFSGDEGKKSVFSGFGGFNKTQPSSFDFLANLTNGKTNNQENTKKDSTSSNLFSNKSAGSNSVSNAFTLPATSTLPKSTFGTLTTQSSIFGGTLTGSSLSPFSLKVDSKIGTKPVTSNSINTSTSPTTSSIFGTTSVDNKPFSLTVNNPVSFENKSKTLQTNFGSSPKTSDTNNKDSQNETKGNNDKQLTYYAKLQGLNESVSDWIKKHVEETPLCILTPIFKDYERYLKEIQDEYHTPETEASKSIKITETQNDTTYKNVTDCSNSKLDSSPLKKDTTVSKSTSIFAMQNITQTSTTTNFVSNATTSSPGFSFGSNTSTPTSNATSSFLLNTTNTSTNGNTPFSFGSGKPFSFSSNIQKPPESAPVENDEDDEPPKVECTPIVEENSVYEKRCKVFVKKDGNFADKGIGMLYIKKIEDSGKHQLLVRANTNLGNVLINLILSTHVPTQRMGKNNVMMVCIPNPDAKPPPTPVLIRVKTSEEADELLETLNKFKS